MTAVGKIMVFVSLILSVASLGIAVWLTLDKHDWKKELTEKQKALAALYDQPNRAHEYRAGLLDEAQQGIARKVKLEGDQEKTVAEARGNVQVLVKENEKLLGEVATLVANEINSRKQVVDARVATEKELEALKKLSELVTPDKPDAKGIPARIEEMTKERLLADIQFESLYPEITNGEARVELLTIRNAELKKRAEDLKRKLGEMGPAAKK